AFIIGANLLGIGVAVFLVTVAFPVPSVFSDAPGWITFGVVPAYIVVALIVGAIWITRHGVNALRWATEQQPPTPEDERNTFLAPWRMTVAQLVLWGIGTALFTTLYGLVDQAFIPRLLFSVGFSGIVVATCCYLLTEFALRPVAAQALEAGRPPPFAAGIMGRLMTVWMLGSGVPMLGIVLAAAFALSLRNMTLAQFANAVLILGCLSLLFGFILMWIVSWITATPVRVVRAALQKVEDGDFDCNVVVFDGTELGELQRGFNSMVGGLRERERVRDLFGKHVGREVAAAAEQQKVELVSELRHVAVLFVDVIGSTKLVASRPPMEVVELLNRFFGVIVEEVDRHRGLVNKFEGDATLAVFGAPIHLEQPEDGALAAARTIARRLREEVPECPAGLGVAAGEVVAGNVGAEERFEYTVIGDPVIEAARLSELAKSVPERLLASAVAVHAASESECAHWELDDDVVLRGRDEPTRLAKPTDRP
ncbi:MAG: HAMP domain-containing protein, partial [Mycolicibacterium sp.]|nr:HAMP domain-containing protein [Mycolicibacterium sp.]